jgi:hypothetical protein
VKYGILKSNAAVHLAQGLPQNYLNAKILRVFKIFQNGSAPAIW